MMLENLYTRISDSFTRYWQQFFLKWKYMSRSDVD